MADFQNILKFNASTEYSLWNSLIKSSDKKPSEQLYNSFDENELDGDIDFLKLPSMDNSKLLRVFSIEEESSLIHETIKSEQNETKSCFE